MRSFHPARFLFLLALLNIASAVSAGPFATSIGWTVPSVDFGLGPVDIHYTLNGPADSVTIEITPVGDTVPVASFPGPTTTGLHIVTWNGTSDNAGGTPVVDGDYRLRIRTQLAGPPDWTLFFTNTAPGLGGDLETLPFGFPASGIAVDNDPESPWFGQIAVGISTGDSGGDHGVLRLTPTLSVIASGELVLDGFSWAGGNFTEYAPSKVTNAEGGEIWAVGNPNDFTDPDAGVRIGRGFPDGTGDADVDQNHETVIVPTDIHVSGSGPGRMMRWTQGSSTAGRIYRASIGDAAALTSPGVTVVTEIDASSGGSGFFATAIEMDDAGNLYVLANVATFTGATRLYRYNAADLAGSLPLNTGDASWDVQVTTETFSQGIGLAIDHGDPTNTGDDRVYVLMPVDAGGLGGGGDINGVYYVGTSGTANLSTTLTPETDRVIEFAENMDVDYEHADIACDFGGNIMLVDPIGEFVRFYVPPGPSDVRVPGPSSQVLSVMGGGEPSPSGFFLR